MSTSFEDSSSEVTEVGIGRLESGEFVVSPYEGLSHDDNVVTTSEGVGIVSHWLHNNF
jgi:hypothetical protein